MSEAKGLIFNESPRIEIASNAFENVPVILQFHDTPIIEVVREEQAGYTTQISIYHRDGTYLAKVKGSQLYSTKAGEKAGVTLRHPGLLTVCEMGGQTLFELRRDQAAALRLSAELYTPTGIFIKTTSDYNTHDIIDKEAIVIFFPPNGVMGLKDFIISGRGDDAVGLHFQNDGWLAFGTNCFVKQAWKGEPSGAYPPQTVWWHVEGPEDNPGLSNCKIRYDLKQ
jgi:hypothetical protein